MGYIWNINDDHTFSRGFLEGLFTKLHVGTLHCARP